MTLNTSAATTALDVARRVALRLEERLAREWSVQNADGENGSQTESDSIADWRRTLCPEEPHLFDRRLQWDGLEESRVAELVRAPGEPPQPMAPWAEFLADACSACNASLDEADRSQHASEPVPFEEVLLPFVKVARRRLRQLIPDLDRTLLASAQASSERALLKELSNIAEQALFAEFAAMRATHGGPGLRLDGPPRSVYRQFVRSLRGTQLQPLIERYPVLGRLLAVRGAFWVEASSELVARIRADQDALAEAFGIPPLTPVAHVKNGLGDSHGGGRTVTSVRFASGAEIMYKPRPLGIDIAFYGLLEWLNGHGLTPRQKTLRVLDRVTYGWVEKVSPRPMSSDGEVQSYFERAGGLLAVCYVLGAMDLHHGNVIAAGADPVPVDLETIMAAPIPRLEQDRREGTVPRQSQDSVLRTGLLPFWIMVRDGWKLRHGGMGGTGDEISGAVKTWRHPNTDWMVLRDEVRVAGDTNSARKHDEKRTPVDHVEDVVHGFERAYALLERHREAIASDRGPLAAFRGCRVRVLLRNTHLYHATIRRSLHPKHLTDGFDHSLQFEVFRASLLRHDEPIGFWPALGSEQRDLENLDYPLFSMTTDRHDLYDARVRNVGTYGSVLPHGAAIERLAKLNYGDRRRQTAVIRFSLACLSGPSAPERRDPDQKPSVDTPLSSSEARAIGGVIESLLVRERHGTACWVGRQWTEREREAELRPLDHTFYDGSIGVALFLTALDTVEGTGHADLAAAALRPLRRTLRDERKLAALTDRTGIGIARGLGGVIYVLTQIGRMTGASSWLDDARLAAGAISLSRIRSDEAIEVLQGASGTLLSLLSLHALVGDRGLLEQAIECGEHILAWTTECFTDGDPKWVFGQDNPQTGFAHGAAGISSALARLARATGDERFAAASAAGFRQARSGDDSCQEDGWPKMNGRLPMAEESSLWRHTWCNGNVGTELGHINYGLCPHTTPNTVSDTANADLAATDHPCCGNLGRSELLLSAGRADLASNLVNRVVERACRAGSYQMGHGIPDARWIPGFFQGLSGIGYQLLRISAPTTLPCVLAFE